jgi:AcrR family transcriptional regulator
MNKDTVATAKNKITRSRGRPREFDLDWALDQAILVFSARGYHASSIGDLTLAMGLTAGSVYKAFKDKRAIFIAAFDRYKALRNGLLAEAVSSASTGRDQLEAALLFYAESAQGEQGIRGCLVVSGATELATFDDEIAQKIRTSLGHSEKLLTELIAAGKQDGSVKATLDEETLGRALLSVTQGMRVLGKTGRSREEMQALVQAALKILD